jgi:hypothetical protein
MALVLFFEVMDKNPPISFFWGVFLVFGLLGASLAYWKWPFALIFVLLTVVFFWFNVTEFHDWQIYPHIWREAPLYLPQFYVAATLSILLPILGAIMGIRRSKQKVLI